MKNEQIIDSWNKVRPDRAAEERMLRAILSCNRTGQIRRGGIATVKRTPNWKWPATIAAGLVLGLAIASPFINWGGNGLELKLSKGVKVNYVDHLPAGARLASMADLMWLTEDELFEPQILGYEAAAFEGVVRRIRNISFELGGHTDYRAIAAIEVGEVLRGPLQTGDTVTLLLPAPVGTNIWVEDTGVSSQLTEGAKGIFMPIRYDETSVYEEAGQRLALLDLADYGLPDGERWLFIEKDDGLIYFQDAYPSFAGAKDLQEVKEIILSRIDGQQ